MSLDHRAVQSATAIERDYTKLLDVSLSLEKEIEKYYLHEEAAIRERVLLLDQIQSTIADERRCLEIDHQQCRLQISAARKNHLTLQCDQTKFSQAVSRASSVLDKEEKNLEERLAWVNERLREEAQELELLAEGHDRFERDERAMERRELQQFNAEQSLEKAMRELKALENELEERKRVLEKKHETISEWNQSLESRERELSRCQEDFREDLRQLEEDEKFFGVYSGNSNVVPMVSQREVMDDHDMTIEKEAQCEEIDVDEDEYHSE
ncbi:hypothetical protein TraAM80_06217 [Trypanosoma rangeli]|uniref:Uncharacterized protein n=1 Tax=Trypanosoma rangeli TaxID=5698 RepID=A0A422NB62_TRYRA|nr:uncharacterized protein TraAM80_06217 [Trypanosoma rangeli]RNF02695.1 hypothetical protein TraAM80_06217 [Trypanosoma rangeli]|eukprot:RNF02695.1 hypothetical protein TraAM80_06217 [Trypanosoma rangeli]